MESYNKISLEDLTLRVETNFNNGDEVHLIEPLINAIIENKTKVFTLSSNGEEHIIESIKKLKELMINCSIFHRYFEDVTLKN